MTELNTKPRRILRRKAVAEKLQVSERTWDRWVSQGKTPPKINLGGSIVGWYDDEIDAWLARQQMPASA